ncbi:unnamed protein product [Rhizoctonia solani]|uniref:Transmembrane protein n=2 Tax=Rhizoctonia solani TaxID=456999 RepID=A0A8H3DA58_9AGAM|nr:putative transmembrane protein [Rhizoctonia solani 123E]CAE6511268.1 unnamed protein product [Rhizoctonia solani]
MSSNPSPTKWIIASLWLATNCFSFNMSNFGMSSFFVIPSALVVTAFHHGYMLRFLRRNLGQAIPRKYFYTFPLVLLLWVAGAGLSIWFGASTLEYIWNWQEYYSGLQVTVSTLIGGALSIIEAGLVIELWRRCVRLKTNGMAGALPLGSLDNFDRGGTKP